MPSIARLGVVIASLGAVLWCTGVGLATTIARTDSDESSLVFLTEEAGDEELMAIFSQQGGTEGQAAVEGEGDIPPVMAEQIEGLLRGYREGQWVEPYLDLEVQRGELTHKDWEAVTECVHGMFQKKVAETETTLAAEAATHQNMNQEIPSGLTVSQSKLSFGTVGINKSKELTFLVVNNGSELLSGGVIAPAPHAVVTGAAFTLAPGASHPVTIRFHPTHPGIYLANAKVHSTGGGASVSLHGVAKRPS